MLIALRRLISDFNGHDLLVSSGHSPALCRHRMQTIATRVRLVAAGFSVLTLAWGAIDYLTLEPDRYGPLLALRLLAAGVFAWLALRPGEFFQKGQTLLRLVILLAMPLGIYLFAHQAFSGGELTELAALNARLYEALPYIVLAGLSIFPLVVAEGLVIGIGVLFLAAIGSWGAGLNGWPELISTLWTLALALGVFLIAQMVQLTYMRALLGHANHDPLTDALTRRSGAEMIDFAFRIACEKNGPLAIAFFDLDNFKSINDDYGHEVGDQALKDMVNALHAHSRRGDEVIRWGGEEFVFLMPDADAKGAAMVISRIMSDWLGQRPEGGPLTASIGFAERKADGALIWDDLVVLADERMYEAKQSGKARAMGPSGVVMPPISREDHAAE